MMLSSRTQEGIINKNNNQGELGKGCFNKTLTGIDIVQSFTYYMSYNDRENSYLTPY